jgi:hypothetical protein
VVQIGIKVGCRKQECIQNFDGESSWKTELERTKTRWKSNFKLDLRETGYKDGKCMELTQVRFQ